MTGTYQEQKMAHALEAIDKKGNIVLQKNGDDALLFMPGAVAEFCIAHGYDEQTFLVAWQLFLESDRSQHGILARRNSFR